MAQPLAQPLAGPQEWHNKGSSCCSPFDLCLMSWCCPCFVHGKVHHRMHKDPNLQGYSPFNLDCCAWYCLATVGCNWILQMMQRSEIRRKFNLKGNGCTDCLCACCCTACDLAQQEKETDYREKERLMANGGAVTIQQVHVQPAKMDGGMQYYAQQPQQPQPQQQYGQQTQQQYGVAQPVYGDHQPQVMGYQSPQQQQGFVTQQPQQQGVYQQKQ